MKNIGKKILIQALDCGAQALLIVDARKQGLPVIYANPAFEVLTGMDASELIGKGLSELVVEGELPAVIDPAAGEWSAERQQEIAQTWKLKNGGDVRLGVRLTGLYERPGAPSFWLLTEVTQAGSAPNETALRDALHDARRRLKSLERTDPATGAPNEGAFLEVLQRDWSIARREQRHLAVVVFQIDCFNEYRDVFSRHAADSLLRKIGYSITGALRRAGDFGARLGEDRFAVLIGGATGAQARAFAERVEKKVQDLAIHHPRSAVARFVTVSFGSASEIPEWAASSSSMLDRALEQLERRRVKAVTAHTETAS